MVCNMYLTCMQPRATVPAGGGVPWGFPQVHANHEKPVGDDYLIAGPRKPRALFFEGVVSPIDFVRTKGFYPGAFSSDCRRGEAMR